MKNRLLLLMLFGFFFVSSLNVQAAIQCSSVFQPKKTDREIVSFIDSGRSLPAGEQNLHLMRYLENNVTSLTVPGAVMLIRAVRPTASVRTAGRQFFADIPRGYAKERMIRHYIEHHRETLTDDALLYFQDLLTQ